MAHFVHFLWTRSKHGNALWYCSESVNNYSGRNECRERYIAPSSIPPSPCRLAAVPTLFSGYSTERFQLKDSVMSWIRRGNDRDLRLIHLSEQVFEIRPKPLGRWAVSERTMPRLNLPWLTWSGLRRAPALVVSAVSLPHRVRLADSAREHFDALTCITNYIYLGNVNLSRRISCCSLLSIIALRPVGHKNFIIFFINTNILAVYRWEYTN